MACFSALFVTKVTIIYDFYHQINLISPLILHQNRIIDGPFYDR